MLGTRRHSILDLIIQLDCVYLSSVWKWSPLDYVANTRKGSYYLDNKRRRHWMAKEGGKVSPPI